MSTHTPASLQQWQGAKGAEAVRFAPGRPALASVPEAHIDAQRTQKKLQHGVLQLQQGMPRSSPSVWSVTRLSYQGATWLHAVCAILLVQGGRAGCYSIGFDADNLLARAEAGLGAWAAGRADGWRSGNTLTVTSQFRQGERVLAHSGGRAATV
jgi:hypothetical protein